MKELSIIIPAFNEARRLPHSLEQIRAYLDANPMNAEVVVVDDGSRDATAAVVDDIGKRWPSLRLVTLGKNRGKGFAVREGMLKAEGRFRVFSDADLSVPIDDLEKLLEPLRRGIPVAIASRGLKSSNVLVRQPWYRETMGKIFNALVRLFVMGGIRDTQCGFKAFTAEAACTVFPALQTGGFGFDVEVLYRARRAGFKIAEVPTRWINSPYTTVRTSQGIKAFLEMLAIPWKVSHHPSPSLRD
jgi:dolichyl-phosphate beta-glucosyltransferase